MLAHLEASMTVHNSLFSKNYYNTEVELCQDGILDMCSESVELTKKFLPKRLSSELLADSYNRLGDTAKAQRVSDCGTFLEFVHEINSIGISQKGKLNNANFCKDRLCPMCSWRRSYKIFAQVSQIMEHIGNDYKFLFLTLTVPNCSPNELSETITRLIRSWDKLNKYKAFATSVMGSARFLEITRNSKTGYYHPHFHIVLAVAKTYGNHKGYYISHEQWLELWRKAYKDDTITQVDIRVARDKNKQCESASQDLSSVVAEIAKYSVKSSDYIIANDDSLTDKIVYELSSALYKRRLIAYAGCFKEAYENLKLDDADDGDLVHLDEKINPALAYLVVRYGWTAGAYKMLDSYIKCTESEVIE